MRMELGLRCELLKLQTCNIRMAHYVGYGWACCWRETVTGCLSSFVSYIGENICDLGGKFSGPEILAHLSLWLRIFGNTRISGEG